MTLCGELAEWSKAVDLKSIVGQPTAGSNPALSARISGTFPNTINQIKQYQQFRSFSKNSKKNIPAYSGNWTPCKIPSKIIAYKFFERSRDLPC